MALALADIMSLQSCGPHMASPHCLSYLLIVQWGSGVLEQHSMDHILA